MFHQKARTFLNSVISQRKRLVKDGVSYKDPVEINRSITFLSNLLSFYPYGTNLNMARFIVQNETKISMLIPEGKYATKRHQDFNSLHEEALNIINDEYRINRNPKITQGSLFSTARSKYCTS